jgi:hypothetical protein
MQVNQLSLEERVKTGCSHVATIDYTDLNTEGDTSKTLVLFAGGAARDIINRVMFDLVTAFDGTSTTSLLLDVGYNGASVDDDDAFIDGVELHNDATEILAACNNVDAPTTTTVDETYSTAESAALNGTRTAVNNLRAKIYAAQEAFALEAKFTSVTANLDDLTSGRLRIYFNLIRLPDLRGINNT